MTQSRYLWLASYPKSGNTWVRLMLESLQLKGQAPDINSVSLRSPVLSYLDVQHEFGIEASELTEDEIDLARPALYRRAARRGNGRLLFRKVHERFRKNSSGVPVFPHDVTHGAIFIVRDPRDVAVSAASFFGTDLQTSVDRLCDESYTLNANVDRGTLQLPQPLGSWNSHAQSWLESGLPILVLRYEDLLSDAATGLRSIVRFLGWSDEHVDAAVRVTAFRRLAEQEQANGFSENPNPESRFFRNGGAGEGRRTLSVEQLLTIEETQRSMMRYFGYL